jgi:hypothetical protein
MQPGAAPWHPVPLSREQYINTASDLLGFDVRPFATFADLGGRKVTPGVSLSALQVEERMGAAEAIAAAAALPANSIKLCDPAKSSETACAAQLVDVLGTRAFRRPLAKETGAALRKLFDAGKAAGSYATGVEYLVAGILQAPDFLYQLAPRATGQPNTVAGLDDHVLASRLAFFLWNSAPDADLLAAAASGALRTGLAAQVQRMVRDPKAVRMREDYYASWLKLGDLSDISRDAKELNPAVTQHLRSSVLAGINDLYQNGGAKVDTLFDSSTFFINDALAKAYAFPATPGLDLKAVALDPAQRHGILTHPALLALLANPDSSDPIKRGVFIEEEVLCQNMPDPIADIPDLPPLRTGLTTRARLEMHRAAPACAVCHALFDPIGMGFENYDAIGRWRTTDQGVAVDSSGEVKQGIDLDGKFANGMELLGRFGRSRTVRDCMAQHWFEYAVSRDVDAGESCAIAPIKDRFRASGDLLDLLAAIAESGPFRSQLVTQEQ